MNNMQSDNKRSKELSQAVTQGQDYQCLKDSQAFKDLLSNLLHQFSSDLFGAEAFDSKAQTKARVSIDVIERISSDVDAEIETGKIATKLLSGEDDGRDSGLL